MWKRHTGDKSTGDGRLYFEVAGDPDNAAVFYANTAGGLMVAVSEEQAVDSFNETFECSIALAREDAIKLRDYLNEAFK